MVNSRFSLNNQPCDSWHCKPPYFNILFSFVFCGLRLMKRPSFVIVSCIPCFKNVSSIICLSLFPLLQGFLLEEDCLAFRRHHNVVPRLLPIKCLRVVLIPEPARIRRACITNHKPFVNHSLSRVDCVVNSGGARVRLIPPMVL
jgi:hypothetical protein